MPSPEQPRGGPDAEPEAMPAYWRASRYEDEGSAGAAYFRTRDALFGSRHALSTYRFQLDQLWHVAVVGEPPPDEFHRTLQAILADGEAVALPPQLLVFLNQRRLQANRLGSWVEGRYRPGRRFGK